jgi:pimeloyl-ACP methyl ester carboxylesterase
VVIAWLGASRSGRRALAAGISAIIAVMPMADVNRVSLYYESTGAGEPPLVLVHGFACGIRSWDFQVKALARGRRVVAYDVRGHGISGAPREASAYSQPISVADLDGLLAHLGIRRAVVGGLSMGGNIALISPSPTPTW